MNWPDLVLPPLNLYNFPRQSFLYDKGNTMNISLTDTNGTYSIYLSEDFETLDEIISLLVKPVLLAAGFCEAQLDKHFTPDEVELVFKDWGDNEEVAANAAPEAAPKVATKQPPMEKVVCKKVAPAAKQATAKMAG